MANTISLLSTTRYFGGLASLKVTTVSDDQFPNRFEGESHRGGINCKGVRGYSPVVRPKGARDTDPQRAAIGPVSRHITPHVGLGNSLIVLNLKVQLLCPSPSRSAMTIQCSAPRALTFSSVTRCLCSSYRASHPDSCLAAHPHYI